MTEPRPAHEFLPPPHANAEAHGKVMRRLKRMTTRQLRQTLIDAGICTPDGELTEHYRSEVLR